MLLNTNSEKQKNLTDESICEFPYSFVIVSYIFHFKMLMIIMLYFE